MRFQVRSLMLVIALLALGLSLPSPVLALTLIFSCPLWLIVFASHSARQDREEESTPGPFHVCEGPARPEPSRDDDVTASAGAS